MSPETAMTGLVHGLRTLVVVGSLWVGCTIAAPWVTDMRDAVRQAGVSFVEDMGDDS